VSFSEKNEMRRLLVIFLVVAFSGGVSAEFVGENSASTTTTIQSIENMRDDEHVTLEGYIVKKIRSEHYMFKNETGEIQIEIDDEDFRGLKVTPETKVRIRGEVDKHSNYSAIDVDHLEIVK
jgi:uncharacterized protein (TIGR00156 family)